MLLPDISHYSFVIFLDPIPHDDSVVVSITRLPLRIAGDLESLDRPHAKLKIRKTRRFLTVILCMLNRLVSSTNQSEREPTHLLESVSSPPSAIEMR